MSKPEDIPQDVWNNADGVWTDLAGIHRSRDGETEIIARAILAAKAQERAACSALLMFASEDRQSLRLALGEMSAQEMRTLVAGIEYLAAAIRNRGEEA